MEKSIQLIFQINLVLFSISEFNFRKKKKNANLRKTEERRLKKDIITSWQIL